MRNRILLSFLAAVVLFGYAAVPNASANGTAVGRTFAVSMTEFPDVCPVGMTMHGDVAITLVDDGTRTPKLVSVLVTVDTPKGPRLVHSAKFKLMPGAEKEFDVGYPVAPTARLGTYTVRLFVTVKAETLGISHTVAITPRDK